MYNETHITHDGIVQRGVTFDDHVSGVNTDSDGATTIDWEEVERVSLQTTDSFRRVPHAAAFDSQEFYRLQATVARPIPQPYIVGGNDSFRPAQSRSLAESDEVGGNDSSMQVTDAKHDYEVGDWVRWNFSDGSAVGKVRERSMDEELSVEGGTRNATEENPAYKIEHWDDGDYGNMVVKRTSELESADKPSSADSICSCHRKDKSDTLEDLDLTPPEGAQDAAQQALDWKDEYDVDAMTETGWARARQLASGEELSPADIADGTDGMANWWARHEEDALTLDSKHEDEPWNDNGYVAGRGWGAETGMNWAMRMKEKITDIRNDSAPTIDQNVVWLKKPRAELQDAAWSLDNRPWTLGHPDTGLVADTDDIRGFWNDTYYNETTDSLKSYLHVPVGDEEAKSFIEDNDEVSVGFRNQVAGVDEYDRAVGGEGPDVDSDYRRDIELDGYQTDMYFDHAASVEQGRCSAEDGCGLATDSYKGTLITTLSEDAGDQSSVLTQKSQTEMARDSKFVNPDDGTWYAVPPEDNAADEWKYPITSCDGEDSVDSAWKLRHHGDISISVETLEERIRRRAEDLDCDMELSSESTDDSITTDTMPCDCKSGGLSVDFDDLSPEVALDKVAAENDSIASYLTELRAAADAAEAAAEELDADVDDLPDAVGMLDERVADLSDTVDELQRPKMEEDAEAIVEATDRFGETVEDVLERFDEDADEIADTRELVEDLHSEATETTVNDGSGAETDTEPEAGTSMGRSRHVVQPEAWE